MLAPALRSIRWEAPADEDFVRSVASSLSAALDVEAIELALGSEAWLVVVGPGSRPLRAKVVEAVPPSRWGTARQPRAGWGAGVHQRFGAEVSAAQRTALPLRCRHTDAYVVLWTPRMAMTQELVHGLAAILGLAVDARVLMTRVARLSRSAHSDNRRLRQTLRDSVVAGANEPNDVTMRSPAMRRCLQRADAVAPYDTPVLVTGPSGAGKELLARRIHARSRRAGGPFVELNCGAIPPTLAESELFGHRRGAFTGATTDHRGVFERAAGGTLLLDEVGELSPATQVKLLRVLQHGTFSPVGSERERHSDARIIAATHRDLPKRVGDGAFREDLFYRLAVFEVPVPSLAERPEDFPHLVRQIVARVAERMKRRPPTVPRSVMEQLAAHRWPGNVRELENTLEGALVMSPGPQLCAPVGLGRSMGPLGGVERVDTFDAASRRAIEAALTRSRGKIYGEGGAAQLLALKPGTLQSKMTKLGIERRPFVLSSDS